MCFPFAAAPPFLRCSVLPLPLPLSFSVSASVSLSLSTSTSWSLSSGSAAALAFNFVCLCSCVCIRSASTPRLALCGRRQFIFGTLTAPWLVLSHSPSYTANARCYLALAGRRAPSLSPHTLTHTHNSSSRPLSACVLVCVSGISCISQFRGISAKGQRENNKNCPLRSALPCFPFSFSSHFYCSLVLCRRCWPLSPLVSCIHFLSIHIVLCAVSHSFFPIHSRLLFSSLLISCLATFLIIVFSRSYPFH